jgi:hypothetical protein
MQREARSGSAWTVIFRDNCRGSFRIVGGSAGCAAGKGNEDGCMGKCPDRPSPSPPAVVGTFPYKLLNGTAWARLLLYGN